MMIIKLLYLAERLAIQRWGSSLTWDDFYSMKNGPVPSCTLNLVNGEMDTSYWDQFISDKSNRQIQLKQTPDYLELSRAEMKLLDEVFEEHGHKDRFALSEETHSFKEWHNLVQGREYIRPEAIMSAVGHSPERIEQIKNDWEAEAYAIEILQPQ